MKKRLFFSALFSILGLFLCTSTAHAGTYTYKNNYTVSINTTASDASGTVTLPRQSNGLSYTAILYLTTDPTISCLPNCLYYKEITGINKTITETFTIKGLDPNQKYYFIISDTSKKHSLEFRVDGEKKFTSVGSATAITASLTGLRGNNNSFQLLVLSKPFSQNYERRSGGLDGSQGLPLHPDSETVKKPDPVSGEIRWNIGNFLPGTTYYVRVIEIPANNPGGAFFTTEQKTIVTQTLPLTADPLLFEYENGGALIKGRLDPAKNLYHEKYTVQIQYSKSAITDIDPKYSVYQTHEQENLTIGIAPEGTYHLFLRDISPGTSYNVRETITFGGSKKVTDGVFNSARGYTPSTETGTIQKDFEDRSYRLLAPFPGLNVLFDPDLCQEQLALGKSVFGGSCDDQVSAFINLALKILIGAAAVLLVLRIMFEGYKYITTDIPRLKVSAKSGLWDAVLGLVLALSSFLILNTINPKLIENTVNIDRLEIGVLEEDRDTSPITSQRTIPIPAGAVASCVAGVEKVTTKGGVFYACKTIALKFKQMIDLAHSQGYAISGGGFRTRTEQEVLRGKHCGAANIYKEKVKCVPPTAYPGRSRHESGLAFDLTCDGATIKARDNKCFVWLQANAKNYGLYNYPAEPWHWSTDGR